VEHHRQQIASEYLVRDFGHLLEHGADVEDRGNRTQELYRTLDVRRVLSISHGWNPTPAPGRITPTAPLTFAALTAFKLLAEVA
jgi:hypothetical protein